MASIRQTGKQFQVEFRTPDGKRRTLRLGKCGRGDAERVRSRVEYLLSALTLGMAPDLDTSAWLASLSDLLYDRLARCGLVQSRGSAELGPFLEDFIAGQPKDRSPLTIRNLKDTAARLTEHFGADKSLSEITEDGADHWTVYLREHYAESTIGRTIKRARQFFRRAVKQQIVRENPFAHLKAPPCVNDSRKYFVTREQTARLLEACPNWQWRLIVALSRFGGLRCPSEHAALTWEDVNWDRKRFMVAWKTEPRWVPIFPELVEPFDEAWDAAADGATHVLPDLRPETNLRQGMMRILKRAGLTPWPRLFHNLRASRQTELADEYPAHVVCKWIGNTEAVAVSHYLMQTEKHFERAAKSDVKSDVTKPDFEQTDAKSTAPKPHRKSPIAPRKSAGAKENRENPKDSRGFGEAAGYPQGE